MMPGPHASYTSADHSFRENDPYARAKYELTLRWISSSVRPADTLYNIGVGSGYFNHLAAARGMNVVGCEPDPEVFAAAVRTAPPGTAIVNGTLDEFARERAPAKFIVMHDVLEHIEDDVAAIRSLKQLSAPGGRIVLSVPAMPELFGLHDEMLGHFRRYTAARLRDIVEPEFVIRRFRWYGMASIPIVLWFSRWQRKPYPIGATKSFAGTVYGRLCAIESRVAEPIGTSIILELSPR
jgi:2-polyprenyl-3-methyl-5-hydroxy-6-metoxy-1,4-benzoquinol methylase